MAKTLSFEVSFPGWKCQGLVGAVMVESECRDGGRSLVLLGPAWPDLSHPPCQGTL